MKDPLIGNLIIACLSIQFERYNQLMHATHTNPETQHQFTPIKCNLKQQQQLTHTADTTPTAAKSIQDIPQDQLFQHFHHYVNVIEETEQTQEQQPHAQRKLSYEDTEMPVKKLFCEQSTLINPQLHEQHINQLHTQQINEPCQQISKMNAPIKVEMMAAKKNNKLFETPPKKQKELRQELLWATLKHLH